MRCRFHFAATFAACLFATSSAWANHPVLVEGNCDSPIPGATLVGVGDCGDFDGDGRIGTAEDTDGADRIFGTISAALGLGTEAAAGTGANQNGQITIVTSGRFAEQIVITAENGNVTLQAAPGVEATIDAVLQADPAGGNASRQTKSGIVVQGVGSTHQVILRNLTIRNWIAGITIASAKVEIIDVRVANNVRFGIRVAGTSRVSIDQSEVIATGFRNNFTDVFPAPDSPAPAIGIAFQDDSYGAVFRTQVSGNFGAGISDTSTGTIKVLDAYLFNNNPNQVGF